MAVQSLTFATLTVSSAGTPSSFSGSGFLSDLAGLTSGTMQPLVFAPLAIGSGANTGAFQYQGLLFIVAGQVNCPPAWTYPVTGQRGVRSMVQL